MLVDLANDYRMKVFLARFFLLFLQVSSLLRTYLLNMYLQREILLRLAADEAELVCMFLSMHKFQLLCVCTVHFFLPPVSLSSFCILFCYTPCKNTLPCLGKKSIYHEVLHWNNNVIMKVISL